MVQIGPDQYNMGISVVGMVTVSNVWPVGPREKIFLPRLGKTNNFHTISAGHSINNNSEIKTNLTIAGTETCRLIAIIREESNW